jgi:hypothetical protein
MLLTICVCMYMYVCMSRHSKYYFDSRGIRTYVCECVCVYAFIMVTALVYVRLSKIA